MSRSIAASTWTPVEIPLEATDSYDRPYVDVEVDAVFEHESGEVASVPGFWNGDGEWIVRFAPPMSGDWEWSVDANVDDDGLLADGDLEVEQSSEANRLREHGFLQVGEDDRHFVHDDGVPFFWLGDTVWSAGAKATPSEWQQYLDVRERQGYSIVQLNSLPQHDASKPHDRLPFGDDWEFDSPNPDYFHALDGLVAAVGDRGMVPAMVVLWFDYVAGARDGDAEDRPMTPEQAARHGRHLAARYGAYGATWLVSGDIRDNPEGMETFGAAAEAIGDGVTHPLRTMHYVGGQPTPEHANECDWLDFHMIQSGHTDDPEAASTLAAADRELEPPRPVVNGEPCYERIGQYGTEGQITREDARRAAWVGTLSGATAGVTYGAHGLWPWHRDGETFENGDTWGQPATWENALEFAGGEDYARLKTFFEEVGFVGLEPHPDLLTEDDVWAGAHPDGTVIAYLERGAALELPIDVDAAEWMNPAAGDHTVAAVEDAEGGSNVSKPSWEGDAVLLANRQ